MIGGIGQTERKSAVRSHDAALTYGAGPVLQVVLNAVLLHEGRVEVVIDQTAVRTGDDRSGQLVGVVRINGAAAIDRPLDLTDLVSVLIQYVDRFVVVLTFFAGSRTVFPRFGLRRAGRGAAVDRLDEVSRSDLVDTNVVTVDFDL